MALARGPHTLPDQFDLGGDRLLGLLAVRVTSLSPSWRDGPSDLWLLALLALPFVIVQQRQRPWAWSTAVVSLVAAAAIFLLGSILVLAVGILTLADGVRRHELGAANRGLLALGAMIVARFFDMDLSFLARGLVFVA